MSHPLRNEGKKIFDPFECVASGQEVKIGFDERRQYEVHRACGHCRGTGKRRDDDSPGLAQEPKCSQCLLGKHSRGKEATKQGLKEVWGRTIPLFAHELTEFEVNHLEPNKKLGAHFELNQHTQRRHVARIMSDQEHEGRKPVVVSRVRTFA